MTGREIHPGKPFPRGASYDGRGVNFALYSRVATRVEVCLFDLSDVRREIDRFDLPETTDFVWHGYVPTLEPGALYGFRVHGPYAPTEGHRCNPNKLLIDPHAKAIHGEVDWREPIFGYKMADPEQDLSFDEEDSAPSVPKGVVVSEIFDWTGDLPPETPWGRTVLYELHVKGFTKLHPAIPDELRGTYAGLAHPAAIAHLKELGVTAVELLPVQESIDDGFRRDRFLRNYWGYSTLGFFAPTQRYASRPHPGAQVNEFKAMVKALHAAGLEVILDVVYNHTCEGTHLGPTLCLRGIDNATYYWLMPEARRYRDFTGCGNSVNASNPEVAQFIVDSLRYWVTEMHVDGFRVDLAPTLGRSGQGAFDRQAAIFQIIHRDPVLSRIKLIAEPWDLGVGGYQIGSFPAPWREWNGPYRDALRRYWKGESIPAAEVAHRLSGSADLYPGEHSETPTINYITAHDGFTLHDLVSYDTKHNEDNGDDNRDGDDNNHSCNHGVEGETDDEAILLLRERQKRNLLSSLFLSQGVPMFLAGDEMGRTQAGNNNAYRQDNEVSWVDWRLDDRKTRFLDFTRRLVALRHQLPPVLAFSMGGDAIPLRDERSAPTVDDGLYLLMNASPEPVHFKLPGGDWRLEWDTSDDENQPEPRSGEYVVSGRSMAVLRRSRRAPRTDRDGVE